MKMTIDQLQQSIAKNKNTEELLSSVKQIETTLNTIQDENARQLLHTKL